MTMKQRAEAALQHPQVQRFLDFLSWSEATQEHNYHTNFGGSRLEDLSHHPNKILGRTKDGVTTATGRYQITGTTWKGIQKNYGIGIEDFSPHNQDLAAVSLIIEKGALDDIIKGDMQTVFKKLNNTWVSLPGYKGNQKSRSMQEAMAKWTEINGQAPQSQSEVQPTEQPQPSPHFIDYSEIPDTLEQPAATPQSQLLQQPAEAAELARTQQHFTALQDDFTQRNGGQEMTPLSPSNVQAVNYDEQLAKAFGIVPSTKGKIPPYIDEMIRSIYDQTA